MIIIIFIVISPSFLVYLAQFILLCSLRCALENVSHIVNLLTKSPGFKSDIATLSEARAGIPLKAGLSWCMSQPVKVF